MVQKQTGIHSFRQINRENEALLHYLYEGGNRLLHIMLLAPGPLPAVMVDYLLNRDIQHPTGKIHDKIPLAIIQALFTVVGNSNPLCPQVDRNGKLFHIPVVDAHAIGVS